MPPVSNLLPKQELFLKAVFEMIRTDIGLKEKINHLRSLKEKSERDYYKKTYLSGVTFCGTVTKRGDQFLSTHSGKICVDIDGLNEEEMSKAKIGLKKIESSVIGYFISPSGNGYKVLLQIEPNQYSNKDNYAAAVAFLKMNIDIDESHFDYSCSNVSRLTFLSYDPNAYFNSLADSDFGSIPPIDTNRWIKETVSLPVPKKQQPDVVNTTFNPLSRNTKLDFNHKSDISNFNVLLSFVIQKNGDYIKGRRHSFIQVLASYANQFGMKKEALKKHCYDYFENHPQTLIENDVFDIDKELLIIIEDVYSRYNQQFGSWLEEDGMEEIETPCFPEELYENLPPIIRKPTILFTDQRERDVYLIGLFAALSSWMPKVQGVYDGKNLGANLFIFISAPASSGKGTLYWIRKICKEVYRTLKFRYEEALRSYEIQLAEYEEAKKENPDIIKPQKPQKPKFIIPGNISSAAMIACIHANKYFGLIFETEADTLANTLSNNDWGNFTDILRKSFHHEPVSYMRKKDNEDIEIEKPFLSLLLSGTPSQITKLVSNVENGFFSRILFYDFPVKNIWKNVFEKKNDDFESYFDVYGQNLERFLGPFFYDKSSDDSDIVSFRLTASQEELFNKWFEEKQAQLTHIYGDEIISSIRRLAVCFFRFAMILSVVRLIDNSHEDLISYSNCKVIECEDIDYKNAEHIINTLLFHTIKIFNQVKGLKRNKFSKTKRNLFIDKLPSEFNRSKAMQIASFIGIKEKTAENYVSQFIAQGLIQRVEHNQYKKP